MALKGQLTMILLRLVKSGGMARNIRVEHAVLVAIYAHRRPEPGGTPMIVRVSPTCTLAVS